MLGARCWAKHSRVIRAPARAEDDPGRIASRGDALVAAPSGPVHWAARHANAPCVFVTLSGIVTTTLDSLQYAEWKAEFDDGGVRLPKELEGSVLVRVT